MWSGVGVHQVLSQNTFGLNVVERSLMIWKVYERWTSR
jgi:hypothetical protein